MELFASYTGVDFLAFYAVMLVTCVFAGVWIPANLRPAGRKGELDGFEEAAVLSGGIVRHTMSVTSDLLARGGLTTASKAKLRVGQTDIESGSAGRSVLRKMGEFGLRELKVTTAADGSAIERALEQRGLLMAPAEQLKLRFLSVLPHAALLVIGLYRHQAGAALGEATGFLMVFLLLTAFLGLVRFVRVSKRTQAGEETLRAAEANAARLRSAPTAPEAGFAVALFGTAVLVGTPWEPIHAMRGGWDSSSTDGGSSDGDGGCGGGGCGGCGG